MHVLVVYTFDNYKTQENAFEIRRKVKTRFFIRNKENNRQSCPVDDAKKSFFFILF